MDKNTFTENPVSLWIDELRDADPAAATKLWRHFFDRLRESAVKKIHRETRRVYDEEDAALSAFHSFCKGISAGRFPDLQDRDDLLALLLAITGRKVSQRHRYDQRKRRDIRRTEPEGIFQGAHQDSGCDELQRLQAREPAPEFVVAFSETCDLFLDSLEDAGMREIATMRIEGYNDLEIATRLDCARSTIQRRLELIRRRCQDLASADE